MLDGGGDNQFQDEDPSPLEGRGGRRVQGFRRLKIKAQSEISEILAGRQVRSIPVLERIVDGLGIPRSTIGLVDAEPTDKALPVPMITVGPRPASQRPRTPRFRRKVMVGPQGPDVPLWTAPEIWSLRQAMRMTANEFASHLGVSARALCRWEAGTTPGPFEQSLLDTTLKQATPIVQSRFILLMTPDRPTTKQSRDGDS